MYLKYGQNISVSCLLLADGYWVKNKCQKSKNELIILMYLLSYIPSLQKTGSRRLTEPAAAGCSSHWSLWVEPAAPGFYQCRGWMWGGYGCSCFAVPETELPVSWKGLATCGCDGASSSAESAWMTTGWEQQEGMKVLKFFLSFLEFKTVFRSLGLYTLFWISLSIFNSVASYPFILLSLKHQHVQYIL